MVANRELCAFFFEPQDQGSHRCKLCGAERKQLPRTGYSNLVSHLASRHQDFREQFTSHHRGTEQPLQAFGFVSEETTHRYHWLRWVVERSMPLCEVDDERTRSMSKWLPTNSKALKADMIAVTKKLGLVITKEMGILFGLLYDGWSHLTMRFIGVYALYVVGGRLQRTLLALSPLDDGSQDADAHIELFRNVLAVYNKTVDMVQFSVADNCNTNRSIATKLGVPLVGCASHRFNLAVNRFLTEHDLLLQKVNNLMSQIRQANNAAEPYKLTPLRAKKRNVTRWSSTYEMLERYMELRPHIRLVEAVEDFVPTSSENKKLGDVLRHLRKHDSVCKRLQCESTTMNEVRLLFDSVVADYPIMGKYLKPTSKIVHSAAFENGLVKLSSGERPSPTEAAALKRLECPRVVEQARASGSKRKEREGDYAAQIINHGGSKRRHGERTPYAALATLVPPTSNTCERLFSECKWVLTPQRSSLLPANFEMLIFLRANKAMWDVTCLL